MMKFDEEYLSKVEEYNMNLAREKKAAGARVVGVYCAFTPRELIAATGAIPVALCGSSPAPIPYGERHLPSNICPLVKSSYGSALSDTCPYFYFSDFLVADATCDAKKKMFELLKRLKPLYLLMLPQTSNTVAAYQYWLGELCRLKDILEEQTNNSINADKIRKAIKLYNRQRQTVRAVYELNKGSACKLTGQEINIIVDGGGFEVDIPAHILRMEQAISLAHTRKPLPRRPRILLTGCPTTCKKLLNIIEESAVVVAMENCGGLKTVSDLVAEEGEPLEALARYYLDIPCPCMTPNQKRYDLVAGLVQDYQVDGVIDLTWQACHTYNIESYSLGEFVRQQVGVPFMQLETDYSESDAGWLKVRVEAFLEML